jgi:hypothetical protein
LHHHLYFWLLVAGTVIRYDDVVKKSKSTPVDTERILVTRGSTRIVQADVRFYEEQDG